MRVLALDLASTQTGFAVFEDNRNKKISNELISTGIIAPRPRSLSAEERLPIIEKEFEALLNLYKPKLIIIENPAGGAEDKSSGPEKNWVTMSVLFMCHGIIRSMLVKRKIPWQIVSPSTWQNRLSLHKRDRTSRKLAAREYVIKTYKVCDNLEQDEYDAICLFDCYIYLDDWKKQSEQLERNAW